MEILRLPGSAQGRSKAVGFDRLLWAVANAIYPGRLDFHQQVDQTLAALADTLAAAGCSRRDLLSVQVFLTDMAAKPVFDAAWSDWIGTDPAGWPQRACVQAGLAPGLLVEIVAVAARPPC